MAGRISERTPSSRTLQLREAKRAQRARERAAGLVACQLVVEPETAERLRAAVRMPGVREALEGWLETQLVDAGRWPVLKALCWNRAEQWLPGREALQLYERNWRLVETMGLDAAERSLVEGLVRTHGGGVLHV
jgi:hypothetical protein